MIMQGLVISSSPLEGHSQKNILNQVVIIKEALEASYLILQASWKHLL